MIAVDVQRENAVTVSVLTTGLIEVSVPQMTISTSTTNDGSLFGDFPISELIPYTFPFPGKIVKVILNAPDVTDLGDGFLRMIKFVGSLSPGISQGDLILVDPTFGLQEYIVDYPFLANDGWGFQIQAANPGAKFTLFIEVEYDLI
jgi:hypothetical protein